MCAFEKSAPRMSSKLKCTVIDASDKSAPTKIAACSGVLSIPVEVTTVCIVAPRKRASVKLARIIQVKVRSALVRSEPARFAPTSLTPCRFAPDKFAPDRLAPFKSRPVRSSPLISFPERSTVPGGTAATAARTAAAVMCSAAEVAGPQNNRGATVNAMQVSPHCTRVLHIGAGPSIDSITSISGRDAARLCREPHQSDCPAAPSLPAGYSTRRQPQGNVLGERVNRTLHQ